MTNSSTTCLYSRLLLNTGKLAPAAQNGTTAARSSLSSEDPHGAMLFVIATVCIYGLGIVFFIAGHLQKRQVNRDEEKQISRYLKRLHLHESVNEDRMYRVLRLKSRLLADSALGQRHNRRVSLLCRRPPGFAVRRAICRDGGGGVLGDGGTESFTDTATTDRGSPGPRDSLFCGSAEPSVAKEETTSRAVYLSRGRRYDRVRFSDNDFATAADNAGDSSSSSGTNAASQICVSTSQPSLRACLPTIAPLPSTKEHGALVVDCSECGVKSPDKLSFVSKQHKNKLLANQNACPV